MNRWIVLLAVAVWSDPVAVQAGKEKAARPERSSVVRVVGSRLTVARDEAGKDEKTLDVPAGVPVSVDGTGVKLKALTPGMRVLIEKDAKGKLKAIRAEGPTITGTIRSAGRLRVTLAGGRKKADVAYVPATDVKVTIDGKPAAIDALKPGTRVSVKLSADGKRALAIRAGEEGKGERRRDKE